MVGRVVIGGIVVITAGGRGVAGVLVGLVVVVVGGVVVVVLVVVVVVGVVVVVVGSGVVVVGVVVVSGVVVVGGKVNVLLTVGGNVFAVGTPPESIPGPEGPGGFSLPPGSSAW